MNKSNDIKSLLGAMSVFQGELENVDKMKEGHGYSYATLGACIDAAKPILKSNGLSVMQLMGDDGNGNSTMETVLGHSSGEYISTTCIIPIAKLAGGGANNPAQVMGASVTYIRRYQFAAIIGLAQEDDDASSATKSSSTASNPADNDKPWYNSFDAESGAMINELRSGKTNKDLIDHLSKTFKINKEVRQKIMELK